MKQQKRIAVINDITGFGRCSAAVAQPIISVMKLQCCVLPTALLSAHTGFDEYYMKDCIYYMKEYINNWKHIGIEFQGISTGFLGSKEQIQVVEEFIKTFKKDDTILLVDPVMGDYGRLYTSYTEEMCIKIKKLLPYADVITPNLTEACKLVDIDYNNIELCDEILEDIAIKLCKTGPKRVVITGILMENKIINFAYERGKKYKKICAKKIGEDRSGTGDVFSSILIASLVNGEDFYFAIEKAVEFINKTIKYTVDLGVLGVEGLCFEEYLGELK